MEDIDIQISPPVTNDLLNELFASAWEKHITSDFQPVLQHSLLYVCAYANQHLVGFVNVAWDGGIHAFLLDTTVHADFQRQGIGQKIVQAALQEARERGLEWVHVDYEPHLDTFYRQGGFRPTQAGLVNLKQDKDA
jgi:GNAT superfamily N-acetyltransferase